MLTTSTREVGGRWESRFQNVVRAFKEGIPAAPGAGAALSIWHKEAGVVNVWAGYIDARNSTPWREDTTTMLFSATKGLAALTIALLADEGRLSFDRRVADYWPKFAVHGKDKLTIRDVLAHRAGLPAPERNMSVDELVDSKGFASALAAQAPLWPRAQSHLYHALTWGPLAQEIVRRATGEDVAEVFHNRVARPLHAHLALRANDDVLHDIAHISMASEHQAMVAKTIPFLGELAVRGMTAGGALPMTLVTENEGANDPRVQRSGLLSMAGVGTASGLARVWSAVAAPEASRVPLSEGGLLQLIRPHSEGPSFGASADSPGHRWGAGVQLSSPVLPWLSEGSFGHDGAGGQMGFADPSNRIGFGYVTNYLHHTNRVGPILNALRTALT